MNNQKTLEIMFQENQTRQAIESALLRHEYERQNIVDANRVATFNTKPGNHLNPNDYITNQFR